MSQSNKTDWEPLVQIFQQACRPIAKRQIGLEVERLGLWEDGYTLNYHATRDSIGQPRPGARDLLLGLKDRHKWEAVENGQGDILGFKTPTGKVSLEPGSQLEFSADPQPDLNKVASTISAFESRVEEITRPWGLTWVGLAVNPFHTAEEIELIPQPRYAIMTDYLGARGRLATSMMRLTTSVQVNLDYSSEAEAIEMLRTALAVAPISYALFGNSSIVRKSESGLLSFRGAIWRNTDPDRTGLLTECFSKGYGFSDYAKRLWNYPLMFAENSQGKIVPAEGKSLAQLSSDSNGVPPSLANQMNAVSELFTEARLKAGYVEVRSIDGVKREHRYAATAFWTGLLYSQRARQFALETLRSLIPGLLDQALVTAIHTGLKGKVGPVVLHEVAREIAAAARSGLKTRGFGEEKLMDPVFEILDSAQNPGGKILELFNGAWKRNLRELVRFSGDAQ